MNPTECSLTNYTEELDWYQALLDDNFFETFSSIDVQSAETVSQPLIFEDPVAPMNPEEHCQQQVSDDTSTAAKRETKKRKREQKKNDFFEEVFSAMSENIESNPNFKPHKCTKYSAKGTPYDHLKYTFSLQ